jgi:hypothetical protein
MGEYVQEGTDALVFVGEKGAILKRGNWRRSVKWPESVKKAGLPVGFRFHDLRHTGNHLAAAAGASTRELMHRMGHGSARAALIYQHATSDRDLEIAQELSRRALAAREKAEQEAKGQADDQGKTLRRMVRPTWRNSTPIAREDRKPLAGCRPTSGGTPSELGRRSESG